MSSNRLHHAPIAPGLVGCFILGLLPLLGCGTGEYASRTEASVKLLNDSTGNMLLHAEPVVDSSNGVSIRLPKFFDTKTFSWRSGARTEYGIVTPDMRLYPPLDKLAGHIFTYEGVVELRTGERMPVYCFAAVQYFKAPAEADAALQAIRSSLAGGMRPPLLNAPVWTDTTLPNAKGEKQPWKVLEMKGTQGAELTATGVQNTKNFDSFSRIYAYRGKGYQLVIGWRAPTSVLTPLRFLPAIEASTATALFDPTLRAAAGAAASSANWPAAKGFTLPARYTPFGRGRLEIQLPSAFNEKATVQIGGTGTMPFSALPGYRLTYANYVFSSKNTLEPVYLYLGTIYQPASQQPPGSAEKYAEQLLANIKTARPDYAGAIEQVSENWKRIRYEGEQPFYFTPVGGKDLEAPGVLEIYVGNMNGGADVIVLAFRTTATVAQESNFMAVCQDMVTKLRMTAATATPVGP